MWKKTLYNNLLKYSIFTYYNKRGTNFTVILLEALAYSKEKVNYSVHENKCTLKDCAW